MDVDDIDRGHATGEKPPLFVRLSTELILEIMIHLDLSDALNLSGTSRYFHAALTFPIYSRHCRSFLTDGNGIMYPSPLRYASERPCSAALLTAATRALSLGANPNARATLRGTIPPCRSHGGAMDEMNTGASFCLHTAIWHGNVELVRTLLEYRADLFAVPYQCTSCNDWGTSTLCLAVKGGHADLVEMILDVARKEDHSEMVDGKGLGRCVSERTLAGLVSKTDWEDEPILNCAVDTEEPDLDIVNMLLDSRPDIFAESRYGSHTALDKAARRLLPGNRLAESVFLTIAAGVKQQHEHKETGEWSTQRVTSKEITEMLSEDIIHKLMLENSYHIDRIQVLVTLGAPIDAKNAKGHTVLYSMASTWENYTREEGEPGVYKTKTAKYLIEHGANIEAVDPESLDTVLLAAIEHHKLELIDLLIRKGANLSARYRTGYTRYTLVQQCISQSDGLKMLNLLFTVPREGEEGDEARLKERRSELLAAKNEDGQGVFDCFSSYTDPTCVEALLDWGAKDDLSQHVHGDGRHVVVSAFRKCFREDEFNPGEAALLLYHLAEGTDKVSRKHVLDEKNTEGWTVLHEAADAGCGRGIEFLLERGAEIDSLTGTNAVSRALQNGNETRERSSIHAQQSQNERKDDSQATSHSMARTALILAIRGNHRDEAMMLFEKGASLELALKLDPDLQNHCETQKTKCKRWLNQVIKQLGKQRKKRR